MSSESPKWRRLFAAGAFLAAIAVAAGAFGAHGLRATLEPRSLEQWETAFRYLIYSGLGAMFSALLAERAQRLGESGVLALRACLCLLIGGVIFAAAVGGVALGGPRLLGAVAPIGGFGMILGFLLLTWAAGRGGG